MADYPTKGSGDWDDDLQAYINERALDPEWARSPQGNTVPDSPGDNVRGLTVFASGADQAVAHGGLLLMDSSLKDDPDSYTYGGMNGWKVDLEVATDPNGDIDTDIPQVFAIRCHPGDGGTATVFRIEFSRDTYQATYSLSGDMYLNGTLHTTALPTVNGKIPIMLRDTGWRSVPTGGPTPGTVHFKRAGNTVQFILDREDSDGTPFDVFPVGFRPNHPVKGGIAVPLAVTSAANQNLTQNFTIFNDGTMRTNDGAPTGELSGSAGSFPCTQAWPTVLPGTEVTPPL